MNALHLVDQKNAWIVKPLDRVCTGVSPTIKPAAVGDGVGRGVGAYLPSDLRRGAAYKKRVCNGEGSLFRIINLDQNSN